MLASPVLMKGPVKTGPVATRVIRAGAGRTVEPLTPVVSKSLAASEPLAQRSKQHRADKKETRARHHADYSHIVSKGVFSASGKGFAPTERQTFEIRT